MVESAGQVNESSVPGIDQGPWGGGGLLLQPVGAPQPSGRRRGEELPSGGTEPQVGLRNLLSPAPRGEGTI